MAFVNSISADDGGSAGTSVATAGLNVTGGNLLWVYGCCSNGDPGTMSVTDTANNTFTQIGTNLSNGDGLVFSAQFYAKNVTGNASDVITLHSTNSTDFKGVNVIQLSGRDTSAPLDTSATGKVTATAAVATGSFVYGANDDIVAGTNNGTASGSYTAGSGYTIRENTGLQGNESKSVSDTTASFTFSSAVNQNIMAALFKPTGGVATPTYGTGRLMCGVGT